MNYQIVTDEEKLHDFIDWLPELSENERFYCTLFSRKKYSPGQVKSKDKTQLKRFLSDKKRLYRKIRQLEVAYGAYQHDDQPVPQESLALYINPNPRDLKRATYESIITLTKLLRDEDKAFNPHAEVMGCIQQSSGKKAYLDFDVDTKDFDFSKLAGVINTSALTILETRGGYHLLVALAKLEREYVKTFYQGIVKLGVDQTGDQLLPVPGCTQGGFTPRFVDFDKLK